MGAPSAKSPMKMGEGGRGRERVRVRERERERGMKSKQTVASKVHCEGGGGWVRRIV